MDEWATAVRIEGRKILLVGKFFGPDDGSDCIARKRAPTFGP